MGILTGTEALFFWLGVLAVLAVIGLARVLRGNDWRWYIRTLAVLGVVFILFGVAWYFSSISEGEPQAANMGVVFFVLPGLLFLGVTHRLMKTAADLDMTSG